MKRITTLIVWLLLAGSVQAAGLYKCTDADGNVTFSQTQCQQDQQQIDLEAKEKAQRAAQQAAAAKQQAADANTYHHVIEPGAHITEVTPSQVDAMVVFAQLHGYRCDSVSSVRPCFYGCKYTMNCNEYKYGYEFIDKGGKLLLKVK